MLENVMKFGAASSVAVVSFLWGEWSMLLNVLLAFVVIDYVSGLAAAWKEGELNSRVGLFGIAKKVFIFVIIAVANLIDVVLIETGTRGEPVVFTAVIVFYIVNESLSILENMGRMDVPLPSQLEQAIRILKGKDEKND